MMADFQLTPLGTSPAWYNPGEAASGYLLEAAGFRLLVDCGTGVIPRYLADGPGVDKAIDAIYISHIHADHCFDLVPLKYGMTYGNLTKWKPQLLLPPGGHERLRTLVSAWNGDASFFDESFELSQHEPGEDFEVGPFSCRTAEVPHFIESFALRAEYRGSSFCYSSDLGPTPAIAPLARGADLFLCEATLRDGSEEPADGRGHLSAFEAGQIAREAGVRSLLLSHIPAEIGRDFSLQGARRAYQGPVAVAESLSTYAIASHLAKVS